MIPMCICSEILTKSIVVVCGTMPRHFFVKKFCSGIAGFHHRNCQTISALAPLFLFLKLCLPNE